MNKKLLVIGLLVLLAFPMVLADASLKASLLRYEPLPAQPGQLVTAFVKLENVGNEDAPNVAIRVPEKFPFKIVRADEQIDYIGNLKSQQSVVAEFELLVDSAAIIGGNDFTVEFTERLEGDEWQESSFNIEVETDESSLTISQVETDEVLPGGEGMVTITVKNNEETVLRNIALQLNMETTSGSTTTDLPFIPVNSATEKRISKLNPGELGEVTYTIKAYPSATPGYYKLPLDISYVDDQGTETENSDSIGVVVKALPELKILLEDTSIKAVGERGTITLQYINKGINDLKFLDTEIMQGSGYEILSSSQDYIGDLDSDDYRSETYTVMVSDETAAFEVKVSYKDENNEEYEETIQVPVRFSDVVEQKSNTGMVVIVLIILAVGFFIYKRRSKAKKKR